MKIIGIHIRFNSMKRKKKSKQKGTLWEKKILNHTKNKAYWLCVGILFIFLFFSKARSETIWLNIKIELISQVAEVIQNLTLKRQA